MATSPSPGPWIWEHYWYRSNDDGYGEHEDGAPFDGTGIGRLWPLLTGKRAHYELALGKVEEVRRLLAAMEASSSEGGLIPEQIWDAQDYRSGSSFSAVLPGVQCRWPGRMPST